jgi:putative AlgH/UPF0301 family transcriptional regulator
MDMRSRQNSTSINKLSAITVSTPSIVEKAADAPSCHYSLRFGCTEIRPGQLENFMMAAIFALESAISFLHTSPIIRW